MTRLFQIVAALWLLSAASVAAAADCDQLASPIEKTVCRNPTLTALDTDLNHLYSSLRAQATVKARADLLAQQRAWVTARNLDCATAEAACLLAHYKPRVDELTALNATAKAADGKLDDVNPVMVTGTWKAASIVDPTGAAQPAKMDLPKALDRANLPAVGATINAAPGKLCLPSQPCDPMGWTRKTLGQVNASSAIARYLNLDKSIPVWVGSSGTTQSYYLLVPQHDGSVWAVFTLCTSDESICRKAAELWTPASPDARILPRPNGDL